jgi:hypothetical protein
MLGITACVDHHVLVASDLKWLRLLGPDFNHSCFMAAMSR